MEVLKDHLRFSDYAPGVLYNLHDCDGDVEFQTGDSEDIGQSFEASPAAF